MWLLARRSLTVRPGRTILFLTGFALAVCVMIALLSVGEAIVAQARDKDLVGGGDVILVPAGSDVDVLKLGGVTSMFQAIPNARFVVRQLLLGPRHSAEVRAISALWLARPVWLRAHGRVIQGSANAAIPSLEGERAPSGWRDTQGEARFAALEGSFLYPELDRFHLPPADPVAASRWAEWWYFNLFDPMTRRYAYLSFFVAGDPRRPKSTGSLSIQLGAPGGPPTRSVLSGAVNAATQPFDGTRLELPAGASVEIRDGRYLLHARGRDVTTGGAIVMDLVVVPQPRAFYPPVELRGENGFVSGYVVPVVLGRGSGTIRTPRGVAQFDDALAYHDHNWGVWRDVHWDWGQATSDDGEYGLVYGVVRAPELRSAGQSERIFALVTARDGFLGYLTPRAIDVERGPGGVPTRISFSQATEDDTLAVSIDVEDVVASPTMRNAPADRPSLGGGRTFLQMRGHYAVRGRLGGRPLAWTGRGGCETFLTSPAAIAAAPATTK